jgi:uncharacterized protein YbbK (DUF523 family)
MEADLGTKDLLLVSACLLGLPTCYDGKARAIPGLLEFAARGLVVPICPEIAGGLPVPRPPAECVGGDGEAVLEGLAFVRTAGGEDVTAAFVAGAGRALDIAQRLGIRRALLKENSPSCGSRCTYDGTFQGRLVAGQGVTVALLRRHGIEVISEEQWGAQGTA